MRASKRLANYFKEMFVVETRVKPALATLLVILFTLSSAVKAQEPVAILTPDDKQDVKLAVYQVHRLAEKILAVRSVRVKAFETARLAAVLWKQDEPEARLLFEKAINLTIANGNDPE